MGSIKQDCSSHGGRQTAAYQTARRSLPGKYELPHKQPEQKATLLATLFLTPMTTIQTACGMDAESVTFAPLGCCEMGIDATRSAAHLHVHKLSGRR